MLRRELWLQAVPSGRGCLCLAWPGRRGRGIATYMAHTIGSKGPLSKPTTAAQPWRRELVFMPHTRRSRYPSGSAQMGDGVDASDGIYVPR
jgi:hypothetical protein